VDDGSGTIRDETEIEGGGKRLVTDRKDVIRLGGR
jgi:hypothetical protein